MEKLNKQNGAVLIISLIMLLLLTLIATSAMQTSTLEEKMAGNLRDESLAFQAAEAALREGEKATETLAPSSYYTNSTGIIDWKNANVLSYSGVALSGLPYLPVYTIEILPNTTGSDNGDNGSLEGGSTLSSTWISWYRITARGTGATENSVVILQSIFRR